MGGRVEFTHNSLTPALEKFPKVLQRNIYQVMKFHEPKIRSAAKHDAPWRDDTGNARAGHDAVVLDRWSSAARFELVLFNKVSYAIWLEVRWGGKYANIMPTIRWYGPVVMKSFAKLLDRMKIEGVSLE